MKLCQLFEASYPPLSVGHYLETKELQAGDKRQSMWLLSITREGLKSLEGSPLIVRSEYNVAFNNIISLEGISPYIGTQCILNGNPLISLQNIHTHIKRIGSSKYGGTLYCQETQISSNILGVLLIKNLKYLVLIDPNTIVSRLKPKQLEVARAQIIVNKYLRPGNKDIHACQQELIDAGLPEYAKL